MVKTGAPSLLQKSLDALDKCELSNVDFSSQNAAHLIPNNKKRLARVGAGANFHRSEATLGKHVLRLVLGQFAAYRKNLTGNLHATLVGGQRIDGQSVRVIAGAFCGHDAELRRKCEEEYSLGERKELHSLLQM